MQNVLQYNSVLLQLHIRYYYIFRIKTMKVIPPSSLIHPFIHSCIHSFLHLLIYAPIHSGIHSFMHSFIYASIHSFRPFLRFFTSISHSPFHMGFHVNKFLPHAKCDFLREKTQFLKLVVGPSPSLIGGFNFDLT